MSSKNALVVGISDYENISKLHNTVNDAEDVAKALRKLGFTVMLETNPTLTEFEDALENFSKAIQYNKEIALFYYSGHGIQVDGKNYLVPKDAELDRELRIKKQTVSLDEVTDIISEGKNSLNIFILDACRDNPFEGKFRSVSRGLAEVKKMPPSTYLAFAAAGGQTAGDGNENERNGVFTGSFLKNLEANPSEELDMIFRKTRAEVLKKSRLTQEPWTNHNLADRHYLVEVKSDLSKVAAPIVSGEDDYLDLLRALYSDGGVAPSERKLLLKKQTALGVSDATANALEEKVKIEYADIIKEYEEKNKKSVTETVPKNPEQIRDKEKAEKELLEKKNLKEDRAKKESVAVEYIQPASPKIITQIETVGTPNETTNEKNGNSKKIFLALGGILLLAVIWFGYNGMSKGGSNSADKSEATDVEQSKEKEICEADGNVWNGSGCEKKPAAAVLSAIGLSWSKEEGRLMNLASAKSRCKELGMRVPTKDELVALYKSDAPWKRCTGTQGWDCVFLSSTDYSATDSYRVGMTNGHVDHNNRDGYMANVRCVFGNFIGANTDTPKTKPTQPSENEKQDIDRKKGELAEKLEQEEIATAQIERCKNLGYYSWDGAACINKPVSPTEDNGKWSAYQGQLVWEAAKTKCTSIGMRLPTIDELKTAYATGVIASWNKESYMYWSSTNSGEIANYLSASSGTVGNGLAGAGSSPYGVRCVR